MPRYFELASKGLEAGDAVEASWPGYYGDRSCYLVLSRKKMLFVGERGLIRTTAEVLLEKPYREITGVETDRQGRMEFTDNKREKYYFTTSPDIASTVDSTLKGLMKDADKEAVPVTP
jgi:hypothetical protein